MAEHNQSEFEQSEFEFLKGSPAFDGLSDQDIRSILSKARPMEVRGGEVLFRQGDPGGQCMSLQVAVCECFLKTIQVSSRC